MCGGKPDPIVLGPDEDSAGARAVDRANRKARQAFRAAERATRQAKKAAAGPQDSEAARKAAEGHLRAVSSTSIRATTMTGGAAARPRVVYPALFGGG